jgi:hypothetical protein
VSRDVGDEGDDGALELRKDGLELPGRHARLGAVDERVVSAVLVAERVGNPAVELDVSFEVRREDLELLLAPCLLPCGSRNGAGVGDLGDELRGDLDRLVVVAAGDPDQAGLVGVEGLVLELVFQLVEELAHLF